MKSKLFFLLAFVALFFSCDTKYTIENLTLRFYIFRYAEEPLKEGVDNKDLIITYNENGLAAIPNYPKLYRDEPYFFLDSERNHTFNICELATEEKVLALHDGWYTYFPYNRIHLTIEPYNVVVRDGKWEDICNVNYKQLPILGDAYLLYSEVHFIDIRTLERITLKSRKKMTIDDIVNAINKKIDNGTLNRYTDITI